MSQESLENFEGYSKTIVSMRRRATSPAPRPPASTLFDIC